MVGERRETASRQTSGWWAEGQNRQVCSCGRGNRLFVLHDPETYRRSYDPLDRPFQVPGWQAPRGLDITVLTFIKPWHVLLETYLAKAC